MEEIFRDDLIHFDDKDIELYSKNKGILIELFKQLR